MKNLIILSVVLALGCDEESRGVMGSSDVQMSAVSPDVDGTDMSPDGTDMSPDGTDMSPDAMLAQPDAIAGCAPDGCGNGGQCIDQICDCDGTGFSGDRCQVDVNECDGETPCRPFAQCVNEPGTYRCECEEGYGEEDGDCRPDRGALTITGPHVTVSGACIPFAMQPESLESPVAGIPFAFETRSGILYTDGACADPLVDPVVGQVGERILTVYYQGPVGIENDQVSVSGPGYLDGRTIVVLAQDDFGRDTRADRTVVVYNRLDPEALGLATYYAEQRGIPMNQLCPVDLPRGHFATPAQLMVARDQIAQTCLCPLVEAPHADGCTADTFVDHLARQPITHLALMRGLPGRLTGTPWPTRNEEPSFDYYLSYRLTTNEDIFAEGTTGHDHIDEGWSLYEDHIGPTMRPEVAHYFALGRIEAITPERTRQLIDRTITAEAAGFAGNIVSESRVETRYESNPGRFFLSIFGADCLAYLSHEPFAFEAPESSWPFERCRWGTSGTEVDGAIDGYMPGRPDTTVPYPTNVSWFIGSNPRIQNPQNNQMAFHNYSTMLRWRKAPGECVAECQAFEDPVERDTCRNRSTDYFRAINTDCVGLHPHFLGQQLRSWPVQYYGFFPRGWVPYYGGESERTAPRVIHGGGYQDPVYQDETFLRFGWASPEAANEDECTDIGGNTVSCPERIAVNLERSMRWNDDPIPMPENRILTISFRYRNQGAAFSTLQVRARINGGEDWATLVDGELPTISLEDDHHQWTVTRFEVLIPVEAGDAIRDIRFQFDGRLHRHLRGFFDLDAVELKVMGRDDNLIDSQVGIGSFSAGPPKRTHHGGWAADVIDRMGGIGVWGSSSHHITNGFAFRPHRVALRVFGGMTMGEALSFRNAKSGLVYVDPMFRSYGVRIHNGAYDNLIREEHRRIWEDDDATHRTFYLHILNGTSALTTVNWALDICETDLSMNCPEWTRILRGVGAVRRHRLSPEWMAEHLPDQPVVMRLRAWRPEAPEDHISSYAYLHFMQGPFQEAAECGFDLDENGMIERTDAALLPPYFSCPLGFERYDLNMDGRVDDLDVGIFDAESRGGDNEGLDFNGDGRADRADRILLLANRCGSIAPEDYDVNDDGQVDAADVALIQRHVGFSLCLCAEEVLVCRSTL